MKMELILSVKSEVLDTSTSMTLAMMSVHLDIMEMKPVILVKSEMKHELSDLGKQGLSEQIEMLLFILAL